MVRVTAVLLGTLLAAAVARAQPVTTADPKYHGTMTIRPAVATVNLKTYNAVLKIGHMLDHPASSTCGLGRVPYSRLPDLRGCSSSSQRQVAGLSVNWTFKPAPESNGLYPDQEPIIVAIGEDTFTLDAGALHANRKGNVFVYRGGKVPRGVRLLELRRDAAGKWKVSLEVAGADLSRLKYEDPICRPMAVIVGDDDGFGFIVFTRRGFSSRKVSILVAPPDADCGNGWPWLNQ